MYNSQPDLESAHDQWKNDHHSSQYQDKRSIYQRKNRKTISQIIYENNNETMYKQGNQAQHNSGLIHYVDDVEVVLCMKKEKEQQKSGGEKWKKSR